MVERKGRGRQLSHGPGTRTHPRSPHRCDTAGVPPQRDGAGCGTCAEVHGPSAPVLGRTWETQEPENRVLAERRKMTQI